MKHRIAVDLDGVVFDFATPANRWIARHLGMPIQKVDLWDWYYNYGEVSGPQAWRDLWEHIRTSDWISKLPLLPRAQLSIQELQDQGHEILFVTHRDDWLWQTTRETLDKHGFADIELHHEPNKTDVDWDILLDDKWDNVINANLMDRTGVLMLTNYNAPLWAQDHTGVHAVLGWRSFLQLINHPMQYLEVEVDP